MITIDFYNFFKFIPDTREYCPLILEENLRSGSTIIDKSILFYILQSRFHRSFDVADFRYEIL